MIYEISQFLDNHPILSLVWFILLVSVIFTTIRSLLFKINEVSRFEAIRLINKEDAVIIDLRCNEDFSKGHIANSVNLQEEDIKNGNLIIIDKYKKKPVIVVCSSDLTTRRPSINLIKAGFERVYVLKDGIAGWNEDHLPLVRK